MLWNCTFCWFVDCRRIKSEFRKNKLYSFLLGTPSPTTAAPTTAEPTTAEPTSAEPTTAEPTTAQPTSAEPTTAEPTTAEPTTAEPTTAEPTTAEPTTAQPTTAEPTTAEPTTAEPTTAGPTTAQPTTAEPTTAESTTASPPWNNQSIWTRTTVAINRCFCTKLCLNTWVTPWHPYWIRNLLVPNQWFLQLQLAHVYEWSFMNPDSLLM